MSHFVTLVLVPGGTQDIEKAVGDLLAPFDENRDVPHDQARHDFWMIGGRWTGMLSGYAPTTDPRNIETCDACAGTGRRDDALRLQARVSAPTDACIGCDGGGTRVKWPSEWETHPGDVLPVSTLLMNGAIDKRLPRSLVTPDGRWHQRSRDAFSKMIEKDKYKWRGTVNKLLAQHKAALAVVCDLHI